jgi:predicted transposase/invertase (TIGR01784 family)
VAQEDEKAGRFPVPLAPATPPPASRHAGVTAAPCDFGCLVGGTIAALARPMLRLLDPKLDVTFKKMFADEQNRDVLISLLTAVLRPASPIVEVAVISPEIPVGVPDDKSILLDVLVRLSDDSLVDVEMQTQPRAGAEARALYYWARLAASELHRGQEYAALPRVALVLLLGYRAFPDAPFHGVFQVREQQSGTLFSNVLEIHTVELPKLRELAPDDRAAEQLLVLWARFMNARDLHELEELAMLDPIMARAKSILEELSADPSAQEAARQRELALLNWNHSNYVAGVEGEARGKAEGVLVVLRARGLVVSPAVEESWWPLHRRWSPVTR